MMTVVVLSFQSLISAYPPHLHIPPRISAEEKLRLAGCYQHQNKLRNLDNIQKENIVQNDNRVAIRN